MPLAFARAIPAFVRSLIFCASTFAKDDPRIDRHAHRRRGGPPRIVPFESCVTSIAGPNGMRTLRHAHIEVRRKVRRASRNAIIGGLADNMAGAAARPPIADEQGQSARQ